MFKTIRTCRCCHGSDDATMAGARYCQACEEAPECESCGAPTDEDGDCCENCDEDATCSSCGGRGCISCVGVSSWRPL